MSNTKSISGARFAIILLCILLIGAAGLDCEAARAQSPAQKEAQAAAPGTGVTLFVSAKDDNDRAVTDLTSGEIRLFEDKGEQKIDSFAPDPATPVLLEVLIDRSGSRRGENLGAVSSALSEFFHGALRGSDAAIILTFAESCSPRTVLTGDLQELDRGLILIAQDVPRGSTALFGAVFAAAHSPMTGRSGRRVLLILSDFDDNVSVRTSWEAIEAAQKTQTSVLCLWDTTSAGNSRREAKKEGGSAKQLSEETGGEILTFDSPRSLVTPLAQIKSDLHNFYLLRFHPTNNAHKGKLRKLKIETSRKGVKLLYSRAYFAPKE